MAAPGFFAALILAALFPAAEAPKSAPPAKEGNG